MKSTRIVLLSVLVAASLPARAAEEVADWNAFGHVLTLLQTAVRIGAHPYPDQAMADLFAGRNHEANQAIASLFAGATAEMPEEYRGRVAAIGRDIASLALKPVPQAVQGPFRARRLPARQGLDSIG